MDGLPVKWSVVKVSDVSDYFRGITYKKDQASLIEKENYKPILRGNNINQGLIFDKLVYVPSQLIKDEQIIRKGDVVFAMSSGSKNLVGKSAQATTNLDFSFGAFCGVLRPKIKINHKFFGYYFTGNKYRKYISEISSGSNINNLKSSHLLEFVFPLPPLPEQHRIVAKIEELFSELDNGMANLQKAKAQLKVYRQSVLKWAFEGRLTNEEVKDGELPEGWDIKILGDYIEKIEAGKSRRCDERPPVQKERGIVKVSALSWGEFDEKESKTILSEEHYNPNYLIHSGDFLFSRANTIQLVGACVIVKRITKNLMLSDKSLRFIFNKAISKEYVQYYLRSKKGRGEIESLSTGNQDSMRNIGQQRIKKIRIPFCPIKEQNQIVQEIESRLSVADKLEETIEQSLKQSETLRQSILKRAFEGKLVAQDANDESAEVLLEGMKNEK